MTTLLELKTKYQQEQERQKRESAEKEARIEREQQADLVTRLPAVCSYLAQREGVDIGEFVQYGRLEGEWHWRTGKLESITFYLELPEHAPLNIRLGNVEALTENTRSQWYVGESRFEQLDGALIHAADTYQRQIEREREWAEREAADHQSWETAQAEIKKVADERQQLFSQIADNPAAILLLKLFIQITKDSESFDNQIANLEEAQANAEYYRSEELSRTRQRLADAEREASEASDKARSLEYERDDLEDKVKKAQRASRW